MKNHRDIMVVTVMPADPFEPLGMVTTVGIAMFPSIDISAYMIGKLRLRAAKLGADAIVGVQIVQSGWRLTWVGTAIRWTT